MRFRPSIALTLCAVISFIILCGLGTWQLQRLAWKTGLIEQVAARMDADPVPLPVAIDTPDDWRFRQVSVAGTFVHDGEAHRTGKASAGEIGYRIFTPLQRPDGTVVMVERGWVPGPKKQAGDRAGSQPEGLQTVTGVLRLPDPRNSFTPDDDPVGNMWFASDPRAMAAAAGLTAPAWYVVAAKSPGQWPRAGRPELNLRNNHLEYAFTWFSLAAILAVIWVMMGLRRGRELDQ